MLDEEYYKTVQKLWFSMCTVGTHPLGYLVFAEVLPVARLYLQVERVEVLHDTAVYNTEATLTNKRYILSMPVIRRR